jgi:hypothetical protein
MKGVVQNLNSRMYVDIEDTESIFYNSIVCSTISNFGTPKTCESPTNTSYSFQKIIDSNTNEGFISFSFNSIEDLTHYYSSYQSVISYINNTSGGASNDDTQINYYRLFKLRVPNNSNPNLQCGDTTPTEEYTLHHTSAVTTGGTGPYTMTLTMPTIINNMNFTNCSLYCNSFTNNFVNSINNSSLSQSNNIGFTTNTGSKYQSPFFFANFISSASTQDITSFKYGALFTYWTFENETYVYSGNNVLVSSLTGRTCNIKGTPDNSNTSFGIGQRFIIYSHNYKIQLTDQNNLRSFQVLASDVSNYLIPSTYTNTAMTVVNNVVTYANPNYCI